MQFLLIICHDDAFAPTQALLDDILAWDAQMDQRGVRIDGNPLRPAADARTVRVRAGKVVLSDGPFSDSAEQICAYELVECESLSAAVQLASTHPMARAATIEVRPIWREIAAPARSPDSP